VELGRFITFEGGEGSGKSTQAAILADRLERAGRPILATREPGGSPAAEEIREVLLSGQVAPMINALERITVGALSPDITFILDIPPEEGLARAQERAEGADPDRFEGQQLMVHERIRRAFLDIADEEPERCIVVDARQPEAMVAEDVWEAVLQRLNP
jgi:dTMP kinase